MGGISHWKSMFPGQSSCHTMLRGPSPNVW